MTFFQSPPAMHMSISKHLTAEVKSEEFVPGKGVFVKWTCLRRQNHFFDALYMLLRPDGTAAYGCPMKSSRR